MQGRLCLEEEGLVGGKRVKQLLGSGARLDFVPFEFVCDGACSNATQATT